MNEAGAGRWQVRLFAAIALGVGILLVAASLASYFRLPTPLPADAAGGEFSAGRALAHVEALAVAPRPSGSAANVAARGRIRAALEGLGLVVEEQEATIFERPQPDEVRQGATIVNLLAKLPGQAPEAASRPAVLLMAHYDSVPHGPGAGDDASGVAAVLETARALLAGPRPANDVLVLLTDGEEIALLGAQAFVDRHPWAARIGVVLNLDARGSSGLSLMFRTSGPKGWLTGVYAEVVAKPRASSLMDALFSLLPNDTDLTPFAAAGVPGMDSAFIGDHPRYHTARDTVAGLDLGSLQHHGEGLLALARELGNRDLRQLPAGQAVYGNLVGDLFLHHPAGLALPLVLLALGCGLALLAWAAKRGWVAIGRVAGGALLGFVAAGAGATVVFFAWSQVVRSDPDFGALHRMLSYEAGRYELGFVLLALAAAGAVLTAGVKRLGAGAIGLGTSLSWLLAGIVAAIAMPGTSGFFLWPVLPALLALAASFSRGGGGHGPALALASAGAAPVLALLAPILALLFAGLGLPAGWVVGALVGWSLALAAPLVAFVARGFGWWAPAAALALALVCLVPAASSSVVDAEHPRSSALFYCLDAPRGRAVWASPELEPDAWVAAHLGEASRRDELEQCLPAAPRGGYRVAEAPVAALAPPRLELVSREEPERGGFRVRLRVSSTRGAEQLGVAFVALSPVLAATVDGERLDYSATPRGGGGELAWLFTLRRAGERPLEVELELNHPQAVEVIVADLGPGLPAGGPPRPPEVMPHPAFWAADASIVHTRAFF